MGRVSVRVRRIVLGLLAGVCFLATVSHGVGGDSSSLAWLVAVLVAGASCLAIVRFGNSRSFYARSMADPKAIPAYVLIVCLALLERILPGAWTVAFWAIILGVLLGFVVAPPSPPSDL
jgi:hypothetical protein